MKTVYTFVSEGLTRLCDGEVGLSAFDDGSHQGSGHVVCLPLLGGNDAVPWLSCLDVNGAGVRFFADTTEAINYVAGVIK